MPYNPPPGKGLHFSRRDRAGNKLWGWEGILFTPVGYQYVCIYREDGQPWDAIPGGIKRTWFQGSDMVQEINGEYGGMGNFLLGRPADPANGVTFKQGVLKEMQPWRDAWFDPTPSLPDHTNADQASMDGVNEVLAKYIEAPEDPTFENAPRPQMKPGGG